MPGDRAPSFTLTRGDSRTTVRREDLGPGPIVLLFFPLAYSEVCTTEMCAVAEDYSAWRDLGATVVGISVDSPYVNARFAADCEAPFPILSDFNREASAAYGVLRETLGELRGVSERAAFVIDPAGDVTYRWVGEHPGKLPPFEEIKAAVRRSRGPYGSTGVKT